MNEKNYEAIIEAILFTMGESVELDKIAAAIELDKKETKAIIEKMMKHYENPSIGVKIIVEVLLGINPSLRIRNR